jgi:integrase
MATLQRRRKHGDKDDERNGTWEIQFRDEYGRKQTITLSGKKFKERIVRQLKDADEVLVDKKINGDPTKHKPTEEWVANAVPEIRTKLANCGLWEKPSKHTVKELWDEFLERYTIKTDGTRKTYLAARKRFDQFFKPNELITKLTKDRIEEWKEFLLADGRFGEPTVAGTIQKAKTVFNWAKEQKWITESPVKGVVEGNYRNSANDREVTMVEYQQLLNACPCQDWRTIITLARIGGMRPCEIVVLRWSDIGVGKDGRFFRVFSPKLNHYKHLREREVPLFPEVLTELDRLRATTDGDQEFVINRYSNREGVILVQPFTTIAKRAGIGKIVRPFDNMRASRATEIERDYGAMAESLWLGHSMKTAKDFYLMVTEDVITAAVAGTKVAKTVSIAAQEPLPEFTQELKVAS